MKAVEIQQAKRILRDAVCVAQGHVEDENFLEMSIFSRYIPRRWRRGDHLFMKSFQMPSIIKNFTSYVKRREVDDFCLVIRLPTCCVGIFAERRNRGRLTVRPKPQREYRK